MTTGEFILGIGGWLTATVTAGIATSIAVQQYKLSKRQELVDRLRFKHELYERRAEVYGARLLFISHVIREAGGTGWFIMGTSSVSKCDSSAAVSVEDQAPLREISDAVGGQAYFVTPAPT
jgi:hypothetical protein